MIIYFHSLDGIRPDQLQGFFTDWRNPPSVEVHYRLLANSDHVVLAFDEASARVVGFIAAITDGVLNAYISMLEVLPAYRGRGIGKQLVRRMLEKLHDLYKIDLVCGEELKGYFERLGLRPMVGMTFRPGGRSDGLSEP